MSEEKKDDTIHFTGLGDAIKFVEDRGTALEQSAAGFQQSFKELTGCDPQKGVNALDVVKIFHRLTAKTSD